MVKVTSDSVVATPSPTKTKPSPRLTRSMRKKLSKSPASSVAIPAKKSTIKKANVKDRNPILEQGGSSPQVKTKQAPNPPTTPASKPVLTQIQENGSSPQVKAAVTPQIKPKSPKAPTTPVSVKKLEVTQAVENSQAAVTPQNKPKPATPQTKAKTPKAAATPVAAVKSENIEQVTQVTTPQAKPKPETPKNQAKTPNAATPAPQFKAETTPKSATPKSSKKAAKYAARLAAKAAAQNTENSMNSESKSQPSTPQPKPKMPRTPASAQKHVQNDNVQNSPAVSSLQVKPKSETPQPKPKPPQTPASAKKPESAPVQNATAVAVSPGTPKAEQGKRKTPKKPASAKKAEIASQAQTDSPQVKAPATPVSKPETPQMATPAPAAANVDTLTSSAKKRKRKNKKSAEEKAVAPETEAPSPAKKPHVETAPSTPKVSESKPEELKQEAASQSAKKAKKNKNKKKQQNGTVLTEVKEKQVAKEVNGAKSVNDAEDAMVDGKATEEKQDKKTTKLGLEPEKVTKGIEALKIILTKDAEKKKVLFDDDPLPIFMQVASIKISKNGQKTIMASLPHPINKARDDSEVILFVKDLEKGIRKDHEPTLLHYQELLKKFHVNRVTEVMPFRQLRAEYMQFEARGKLTKRFDTFLVDDRIASSVASALGKQFFKTGKVCIPVDMTSRKLKEEIDDAIDKTYLHLTSNGNCSQIQIGLSSQTTEEIAANAMAVGDAIAQKFPGGMLNVRSLVMRTPESVAVPIYYSFLSRDCIRMKKKADNKKQYVGELSTLYPGRKVRVTEDGSVEVFNDRNYVRGEVDKDLFGPSDEEDEPQEAMEDGSEASSEEQNENDSDEEDEKPASKKEKKANKTEDATPKAKEALKVDEDSSDDEEADEAEREYLKRIHGDEEVDQKEENDMESEEAEDEDGESEEEVPVKKEVKKNSKASKPVQGKGKK